MEAAELFLTSFAQALATSSLYKSDHPARARVVDAAFLRLDDLCSSTGLPVFSFLDYEVLLHGRPLVAMRNWSWARRLSEVGIQRIEVIGTPSREDFGHFVDEVQRRLAGEEEDPHRSVPLATFRYGSLTLDRSTVTSPMDLGPQEEVKQDLNELEFAAEADAMQWVTDRARESGSIEVSEVDLLVRALAAVMHGSYQFLIPVLSLKDYDQYTTIHSLNVSVLAMAMGEFLGLDRKQIHAIGVAGVLHDIGKVKVPTEVLGKSGRLDDSEWDLIRQHPVEGAKMILSSDSRLDLAATLAYEHHKRFDGGGYPSFTYSRPCHPLSHLLQVCDVYDALATNRPYRGAKSSSEILTLIESGAGTEFDPHMASAFSKMIRAWSERMQAFGDPDQGVAPVEDAVAEASPRFSDAL